MPRRLRPSRLPVALLAVAALVVTALTGCSSQLGYAAVVNGKVISEAQLNRYLAYSAKNKQFVANVDKPGGPGPFEGAAGPGSYGKTFVAVLLSNLIEREIIHQVLVAHHGLPSPADLASAKTAVSQQQGFSAFPAAYQNVMITQQAEVTSFLKVESMLLTPDQINNYYVANEGNYASEACVSDIVVADKSSSGQVDLTASHAHALQIKATLDGGADFATVAMMDSADNGPNGTAASGGKIMGSAPDGCLASSDLESFAQSSPQFVRAVVTLPLNTVSAPVMTNFGYHLVKVTSRVIAPLSAVKSDIEQNLAGEALNALVRKADVKVNPAFGTYSSTVGSQGAVTGVIPPATPQLGPLNSTPSTGT